ncbi:Phd finger family protein [Thalictrum thalictroides]|uniref:Phd finger family protein n=1 Tax=Thalictrum thalictroides TaxID=46969 RepID=A0A7J6WPP5_THATH|nr:Phd finger family protein [Thalictrum thalictroides]
MKQDLPSECGGCGLEEKWLLHHVCVRDTFRRICTSCVLKLHSGAFCPICFEVYEGSKLPVNRVMCLRCPSVTHLDCVSKEVVSTYVCPPCANPNFSFFDSSKSGTSSSSSEGNCGGVIDVKMAKVLVAAAQIALVSMSKKATAVKLEADRKVKEAALKRKEAKEALQRFSALTSSKEKKGKEMLKVEPTPTLVPAKAPAPAPAKAPTPAKASTPAPVPSRTPTPVPVPFVITEQKKSFKGNAALSAAVMAQQRFENQSSVEANNRPGRVAVPPNNLQGPSTPNMQNRQLQNPSRMNEKPSYLPQVKNNVVLKENEKNGLFSASAESGKIQNSENIPDTEAQRNSKGCTNSETSRQMPQPNQDSLVKNEGVLPAGSSNTES